MKCLTFSQKFFYDSKMYCNDDKQCISAGRQCFRLNPGGYSDLGWVRMCGPEFQLLPYSKT